ncbi:MAG: hypothetical protein K0R54_4297 [Clostridiaceae bacterium]|jgi:hypothetical protein|nr:hypothetical protein [Clostridiaceae bacterium]
MNKKLVSFLCALTLVSAISLQQTQTKQVSAKQLDNTQNQIYEKNIKVNLRGINLSVTNNELKLSKKSNLISSYNSSLQNPQLNDQNISNLNEIVKDESIKENLINLVKQGKTPVAIATKSVYEERSYDDKTKNEKDRLLTIKEVNNLKSNTNEGDITVNNQPTGNHTVKGRLTLSVTASPSTAVGQYWVQAGASWSLSGAYIPNSSDAPGSGDDFIGVGWNSKYCTMSNPSATGAYQGGTTFTPTVSTINPNAGTVWSFVDDENVGSYQVLSSRAYAGVGVENTGSSGYAAFTALYGHTWSSVNYSASISAGGGSISLSPTSNQWTTAVSVSDNFN